MNKKQVIARLESIERELAELKAYISHADDSVEVAQPSASQVSLPSDERSGYTLDDLYAAFGKKKKGAAYRLRAALRQKGIASLDDFLNLPPGEVLGLNNVGYETLLQTKKAISRLGLDW